LGKIFLENPRG